VADRDKKLVDVLGRYDLIINDEAQDMGSNLEIRLIMQSKTTPVVLIGPISQQFQT